MKRILTTSCALILLSTGAMAQTNTQVPAVGGKTSGSGQDGQSGGVGSARPSSGPSSGEPGDVPAASEKLQKESGEVGQGKKGAATKNDDGKKAADKDNNRERGDKRDASEGTQNDKSEGRDNQNNRNEKATGDAKSGQNPKAAEDNKSAQDDKSISGKKSGPVDLSDEQKTKVRSSFRERRVSSAKNIDFDLRIGISVPRTISLYEVPSDIVVLVPAYRSYKYFVVGDLVYVVEPDSLEVVDIIELV